MMAEGEMNRDSSSEAQPWILRSRKRKHQCDDVPQTDEDTTEENTTEVTPPPHPLSPLQECPSITPRQDEAVDQPCLLKQDHSRDVKHTEDTNVCLTDVKAVKGQEESSVTIPCNASELEGCGLNTDTGANKSGMEETTQQGVTPLSPDQLQVFSPTSEADGGSCAAAPEKQPDANEASQCDSERIHVEEVPKEAVVGLPANKKRRMGMCNLTEKERSHFLQTQKRENGPSRAQGAETHICDDNAGDLVAQEQTISSLVPSSPPTIPADCVTEQSEAGTLRTETAVQVTHSDEISTACDPVSSEAKREAEPELSAEPKSDPHTRDPVSEHVANQKQQEPEKGTTEVSAETPKTEEEGSTEAGCDAAIKENSEGDEKKEAADLRVNTQSRTSSELEEDMVADATDGTEAARTPSTLTGPVECNSDAAATPIGSEGKDQCDAEDAPRQVAAEQTWTRTTTTDLFSGSGCFDYISDSQLNTIVLNDEEMKERERNPGSSDGPEDATDLIRGLIRELSSINQKVMSTHRELENLHRGSKTSRRSKR